jgi:hypothetical protein
MPAMSREELLWRKLEDEMAEELIAQAASVSVAQAEKELAQAGFDVAAERARAEGFLASLEAGVDPGAEAAVARPSPAKTAAQAALNEAAKAARKQADRGDRKKRPVALWLTAAATVTAGAAVAYVETRPEERTPPLPTAPDSTVSAAPSPDLVAQARDLRRQAAVACNEGRTEDCLGLLDDAAKKDPAGDTREEARVLRKQAEEERRRNERPK